MREIYYGDSLWTLNSNLLRKREEAKHIAKCENTFYMESIRIKKEK